MTPLACDIQHRHQHGAFGMKTRLRQAGSARGWAFGPGRAAHVGVMS